MPRRRQGADPLEVQQLLGGPVFVGGTILVQGRMLRNSHAAQVVQGIVNGVEIDMMDNMPRGYGAVRRLPHNAVE